MRLLSVEGQHIGLPNSIYGYDVLARIGWLRQERRDTYAEIVGNLTEQVRISESHVRYLYQQVYLPLLACHERQHQDRLSKLAQQYGGLLISLDGLAPEGGEPQLWFIREHLSNLTLRSGWLSRFDQTTFEALLEPLTQLDWPILAVLSDKQKGLPEAVASVLPNTRHQFCHSHYLGNLVEPLAEADSAFKVQLRQAVRAEVGLLIRSEEVTDNPQPALLTVTGLLPSEPEFSTETIASPAHSETDSADEIATQLLRHTRYLLTLKGHPPSRLAGIETYQRLQGVVALTGDLLAHRHDPRLAALHSGLETALSPFAIQYQALQQKAAWIHDIDQILASSEQHELATGAPVAQTLRSYLNHLLQLPNLSPDLDAFRHHLDKVSSSYWPGLFHCYDIEGLPRTNNAMESHFRDTKRRLFRTNGQFGQTRHTLQRFGAWELLPRPPTEPARLSALRSVSLVQFVQEQQRLRLHCQRFRFHTCSVRRINTLFGQLRKQWFALAATSSG
jgi:hypothetical protein